MKKQLTFLCLAALIAGEAKSQIFINTPGGTSNTDPTYHNGKVSIGKTTSAVEMLDVEGNIGIPYGSYFGTNNTTMPYRKMMQSLWDNSSLQDYVAFFTPGNDPLNQSEKMRITMKGNVGIGTPWQPEARLTVYESNALTSGAGDFKLITSLSGNTGGNNFKQNTWLRRDNSGLGNWSDVRLMDGISIDVSFANPKISTDSPKTWWERDPYDDQQFWGNEANTYMQLDKGRLGINRTSPSARLDITETDNNYITFLARDEHTVDQKYCIMASVKRDLTKAFTVGNNTGAYKEPFVVYGNGQTRIGLQKPITGTTHADAMLSVDGKIVSKSMYVTQQNWADFVFDKDYILPKLSDIESYYKANKHLPLIPSAEEVKENGIDLGEMNKLLLQKIEELTILMVEQDKRIKQLENNK